MVHKINIDGLAPEDYRTFTDNYLAVVLELTAADRKQVNYTEVEKDANGKAIIHQWMDPNVMFVSARSMIVQQYSVSQTEGHIFFLSSKDSAELEKKYASKIGKDVIGTLEVNYWHFKPNGSGTSITHVVCSKPNGSLPDMAVKKMSAK